MRLIPLIAAASLVATPAFAGDRTAGWAKWVERAERIEAAIDSGEGRFKTEIKSACSGVTGTLISQGFQFPYWAQGLIQVCTVLKDNWIYKSSKAQCKDVKHVIAILNKAIPVPEAPRAEPIAKHIAAMMQGAYDAQCKR
ncbi:MAG: hypothetical protein EOP62_22710 [Sphingomonadales bacterium]|nr:MAG: hypothetical protein EOP62_22710 [Sphingomonadales bacterium]